MRLLSIQTWTNWLKPETKWKGSKALVPVETCYRILNIFLWLCVVVGIVALALFYLRGPALMNANPIFWIMLAIQFPLLLAAVFRGWSFNVRAGHLITVLFGFAVGAPLVVGLPPNWAFFIIFLTAATSLFYGVRVGMRCVLLLGITQGLIACGWISGWLPLFMPSNDSAQHFLDYTSPLVWVRVLFVNIGMQAGLVLLMRYVLADLNEALREANRTLHKLAVEQEYRARAEEGRLKAELAVRESQKFDALGRMASGIAHDFNNALCVMKGWSSVLLEDVRDPLVKDAMADIKRATDNAAQLTYHLLAFSRSDPVKREVVNLAELVLLEAKTLRRLLPADLEVSAESDGPVHVRLGRGQIQEIILNLAINARDAMPRGGRLTLQVAEELRGDSLEGRPAGRYARLEVKDTGTGMDRNTQAHMFEPFFTTKAPGKGTGLGLAMVYGLVSGAGGWIEVQSTVGQGTTFTIRLPKAEATDISVEPPMTAIPNPIRCRVLVADAQPEIRSLVERILVREGFPVIAVATGAEALAAMEGPAARFGLLVIEGIMPVISTSEVIDRALAGNPDCRVIIASSHQPEVLLQRGIEAGRFGQLAKPFDAGQLRHEVNEVLGKNHAGQPPVLDR